MKYLFTAVLAFISFNLLAQNKDYRLYHSEITKAENAIFVNHDSTEGLKLFKKVFTDYDFVFVDDCIEAFQLALYFKQEKYADFFIKKALENGFELKFLDLLSTGCPCNYYADARKATIHNQFINKHRIDLEKYSSVVYSKYKKRIDTALLPALLKRHVREQLFKNFQKGLSLNQKTQDEEYDKVCNSNLSFIDSLAKKRIFLGERNLGIYTNKLMDSVSLPIKSIEGFKNYLLGFYGLPKGNYVPVLTEGEYFGIGPFFNICYHNTKSFGALTRYRDDAINLGFLHPREYARLMSNGRKPDTINLMLTPSKQMLADTKKINEARALFLLPTYESDYAKHEFAHKHGLQLFFGFFNGTR
jgi:hypothetical protein